MTHVPHVPITHACPPAHWLFEVHAVHAPLAQICPLGDAPNANGSDELEDVQSALVEQAVHTPLMHACPLAQSVPDRHAPHWPPTHPWPDWHPAAVVHVQEPAVPQVPEVP